MLILVLLSNSSLALEIVTHDNHQHGEHQEHQQMHAMSMEMSVSSDYLDSSSSHNTDDCLCDDICCVSSVGFSSAVYTCVQFGLFNKDTDSCNLYQSIDLDLLLPPPNS